MGFPLILWRNIFRTAGAVITSSGADVGFNASDVADYRPGQGWQGNVLTSPQWIQADVGAAGQNADYILLVYHNIVANGGQVTIKADGSNPPTTTRQAAYSPVSDVADYKAFTAPGGSPPPRYWRIEFSDPAAPFATKPFIGEMLVGMKMTPGEYVAPNIDPRMHDVEAQSSRSPGGHFLGAVLNGIIRRGTLRFGGDAGVARATFTSDLTSFLTTHYRKLLPWGFVFDSDDSEFSGARYLKKPDDVQTPTLPVGNSYGYWTFDLPFEEAIAEVA